MMIDAGKILCVHISINIILLITFINIIFFIINRNYKNTTNCKNSMFTIFMNSRIFIITTNYKNTANYKDSVILCCVPKSSVICMYIYIAYLTLRY